MAEASEKWVSPTKEEGLQIAGSCKEPPSSPLRALELNILALCFSLLSQYDIDQELEGKPHVWKWMLIFFVVLKFELEDQVVSVGEDEATKNGARGHSGY